MPRFDITFCISDLRRNFDLTFCISDLRRNFDLTFCISDLRRNFWLMWVCFTKFSTSSEDHNEQILNGRRQPMWWHEQFKWLSEYLGSGTVLDSVYVVLITMEPWLVSQVGMAEAQRQSFRRSTVSPELIFPALLAWWIVGGSGEGRN
jgi:hypothetical protein